MSLTPDEIRALWLPDGELLTDLADTALALYERNEALEAENAALRERFCPTCRKPDTDPGATCSNIVHIHREKLEAVVRALAESDPTHVTTDGRSAWCSLCRVIERSDYTFSHESDCPWRQARELTEGAG